MPIGIAPTALHKLAHPEGEIATAKAAGKCGTIFILSSYSTTSMEEVAEKVPETIKFLQVHIHKTRSVTKSFVKRAEACGFKAIVVTIDTPMIKVKTYVYEHVFPLPNGLKFENYGDIDDYVDLDTSLSWDDIKWIVRYGS